MADTPIMSEKVSRASNEYKLYTPFSHHTTEDVVNEYISINELMQLHRCVNIAKRSKLLNT